MCLLLPFWSKCKKCESKSHAKKPQFTVIYLQATVKDNPSQKSTSLLHIANFSLLKMNTHKDNLCQVYLICWGFLFFCFSEHSIIKVSSKLILRVNAHVNGLFLYIFCLLSQNIP